MSQTKAQLIDPVDGTIVNADINASAGIAGSKISPNFGSQNIVTTGSITGNDLEIDSGTLSVDASNNRVGIGTTSPVGLLDLDGGSSTFFMQFKETSGAFHRMGFKKNNNLFQIGEFNNAGTSFTTILNVDADGDKVGIGTASPDTLLHLSGADTAIIRLENSDNSLVANQIIGGLEFEKTDASGAGAGVVGGIKMFSGGSIGENTYLTLSTSSSSVNNVERLRIDSSGRVLIGTTTEGFATADNFTISDTSSDCGMTIRASTSNQSIIAFSDATSGTGEYAGQLAYYHSTDEMVIGANTKSIVKIHDEHINVFAAEGTSRVNLGFTDTLGAELSLYDQAGSQKTRITGSANTNHFFNNGGNVGIGLNAPNKALHIFRSSSDAEIRLQTNSGTEENAYITLRNSGGILDIYSVTDNIQLHANNNKRGTVNDTSGITGIEHFQFVPPLIGSTDGGSNVSNPVKRFNAAAFNFANSSGDFASFQFNSHWRHRAYANVGFWYGESGNQSGATYDFTVSVQAASSGVGYTQQNHSFTGQIGTFSNGKMRKHDLTSSWPAHAADRFVQGTITFARLQTGISLQYMGMRVVEYTNPA